MKKDSKRTPTRMVFEKDKSNPSKPKKSLRESTGVKDTLPTKNGIYKPKPVAPAKETSSTKSKPKYKGNNKVQFSSREKAEKAMRKNVKRKQQGKSLRDLFDL